MANSIMEGKRKKYDYIRMSIADNSGDIIISYDEYYKQEAIGEYDHCCYRSTPKTDTFTNPTSETEKAAIFDRLFELNTAMI